MKYIFILSFFASLWLFSGCVDDPEMNTHLQYGLPPELSETSGTTKASSIEVSATILKENGSQILECGVCWSRIEDETPKNNIYSGRYKKTSKIEDNKFKVTISDLHDNTSYYIYAYAINETDTSFSAKGTYRTIEGIGQIYTIPIDSVDVNATSVKVSGKIKSRGEGIEKIGFYLSEKNNPPSDRDSVVFYMGDHMVTDSFSCFIKELKPSTSYYIRAFATNVFGEFSFNVDSFKTTDGKPKLGFLSLDSTSFITADLSASLISEGDSALTVFGFCWGDMEIPTIENADTIHCLELDDDAKFSGRIQGLESNKKYYVRAYAANVFGTAYSLNTVAFFPKSQLPTVTTKLVENIVNGSATIVGKLQDEGISDVTSVGFCWSSTNSDPKIDGKDCNNVDLSIENLDEDKVFRYTMEKLVGARIYYVNTYAKNASGIQYGMVQSFTTPAILIPKHFYKEGDKRTSSVSFTIKNEAFIVGGDLGSRRTDEAYRYDAETDQWITAAPYPKAYSQMTACIKDDKAYIIGGTDNAIFATDVYTYTSSANTWTENTPFPESEGRYDAVSFVYKDSIYVLGGVKNNQGTKELWKYDEKAWVMKADNFPVALQKGIVLVAEKKVYAGLGDKSGLTKGFWIANDSLTDWKEAPGLLPDNIGVVSTAVHYKNEQWNSFFMVDNYGKIWEYALSNHQWIEHLTTVKRMNNYHMFILNDQIYILGQDRFEENFFFVYNPVWDPGK